MNTTTNIELENGGLVTADLAAVAEMSLARQEAKRDLKEPALENHRGDGKRPPNRIAYASGARTAA